MDQEAKETPESITPSTIPTETPDKTLIGILSYISVLVIIAYFMGKDHPSTHFHIKQGIVLFIAEIAAMTIIILLPILFPLFGIIQIALVVLAVIGIVNVVRKKDKELPLIGRFAVHVPLTKA